MKRPAFDRDRPRRWWATSVVFQDVVIQFELVRDMQISISRLCTSRATSVVWRVFESGEAVQEEKLTDAEG